jgi:hypothetical protein
MVWQTRRSTRLGRPSETSGLSVFSGEASTPRQGQDGGQPDWWQGHPNAVAVEPGVGDSIKLAMPLDPPELRAAGFEERAERPTRERRSGKVFKPSVLRFLRVVTGSGPVDDDHRFVSHDPCVVA